MHVPTLLACLSLCLVIRDTAAAFPLVLCNGLNSSQMHVRGLEVSMHSFPDALMESECVSIDACTQKNHRGQTVPARTWLWRNNSALWMEGNETKARGGETGKAYNFNSLEFARVPEGIKVEACEPDFDAMRLRGETVCAAGTVVSLDMHLHVPACPSTTPFSLLDCMKSLQRIPVIERLPFRAKNTHMAFGSLTWDQACAPNLNPQGRALCSLLENSYELRLPLATATSRTQLVRYDFSDGFGCLGAADVSVGQRLSRIEHPNTVVDCPSIANGKHVASADPGECAFSCDAGYTSSASACVLGCVDAAGDTLASTVCAAGEFASAWCEGGGVTYYKCSACRTVPGSSVRAWSAASADTCVFDVCPEGTAGVNNACVPCAVHTYAARANMSACESCNTSATGLYQPQAGQSSCTACFASAPSGTCAAGKALVAVFSDIKAYFARTGLVQHEDMTTFCMQGHACLACEPGSALEGGACAPCESGKYQPHFQSTACFACSYGQSTNRTGATLASECLCQKGFE